MNVAVGRLHVMVTLASPDQHIQPRREAASQSNTAERAYRRERMREAVESDRSRWHSTATLSPRWPG